jgi:hypothetical protein
VQINRHFVDIETALGKGPPSSANITVEAESAETAEVKGIVPPAASSSAQALVV